MKKTIIAMMALAAALCACTKEQSFDVEQNEESSSPLVFTATMEGTQDSKATISGMTPNWETGDQLVINGSEYEACAPGTTTTFRALPAGMFKEMRPVYISTTTPNSFNNSNPASNLVDDMGVNSRWCASTNQKVGGLWNIVVSTRKASLMYSIKLWNADNQSYPGRRWKSIKVYGSASLENGWEEIKSLDNLELAINKKGFAGEIIIKAAKEYIFYKIDVLENEGDDYMQMSDMKFVVIQENMRPAFVSSTNTQSYNNQPASNLVDIQGTDTRWIAHKDHKVDGVWNIVVSTGSNTFLKTIKLWNADNDSYPGRRWKNIRLYGRESATDEWQFIKSCENLNLARNDKGFAGDIAVNSSEAYTFYKIDVLDNEGDNYMQMSDMKFESEPGSPYSAYFPASLYNGEQSVLPSFITESWAEGKFNMPMYAQSNTPDLQFKNLCGVLKIVVTNNRMNEVKSIRVSSANKAVSGVFTVVNNAAVLASPNEKSKTLTVTYTDAVPTTAEGTVFYVAIPAQTYRDLKIELSSDGENFTRSITTKADTDIVVARNKIYPINQI